MSERLKSDETRLFPSPRPSGFLYSPFKGPSWFKPKTSRQDDPRAFEMKIGGFKKLSLTDYPGLRAAVIYTQGCHWRCPYCFHKALVIPSRFQPAIPEAEIIDYLKEHRSELDALVVSGGEPTFQASLTSFLRSVRSLGLKIKLETHGGRPATLAELFNEGLIDFVAMDIKGPLNHYDRFTGVEIDPGIIELSLDLVAHSGVPYELRTTLVGGLHSTADIAQMAPIVYGAKRFAVQGYRCPAGRQHQAFTEPETELYHAASELLRDRVEEFMVR